MMNSNITILLKALAMACSIVTKQWTNSLYIWLSCAWALVLCGGANDPNQHTCTISMVQACDLRLCWGQS